jgi:hypothetical protein
MISVKKVYERTSTVTSKRDITWYVKWGSSIIILLAVVIRAIGSPELMWLDMVGSAIGSIGWLIVGVMWKDRALILLNLVIAAVLLAGIVNWVAAH